MLIMSPQKYYYGGIKSDKEAATTTKEMTLTEHRPT